jgi:hypothetical protein
MLVPLDGKYVMDKDNHSYYGIEPYIIDMKKFGLKPIQLDPPVITYDVEAMKHTVKFTGKKVFNFKGSLWDQIKDAYGYYKRRIQRLCKIPWKLINTEPSVILSGALVYNDSLPDKPLCFCIRLSFHQTIYLGDELVLRYTYTHDY